MDNAVNSSTAQKGLIGRVDDGIHIQASDIALNDFDTSISMVCWHEANEKLLLGLLL